MVTSNDPRFDVSNEAIGKRLAYFLEAPEPEQRLQAERLEVTVNVLRSWFRGTRMPDVSKLIECSAIADVDPVLIIFGLRCELDDEFVQAQLLRYNRRGIQISASFYAMSSREDIGRRLRKSREAADWTAVKLANEAAISHQALLKWEVGSGEPSLELSVRIAKLLCVDPIWLVTGFIIERNLEIEHPIGVYKSRPDEEHEDAKGWNQKWYEVPLILAVESNPIFTEGSVETPPWKYKLEAVRSSYCSPKTFAMVSKFKQHIIGVEEGDIVFVDPEQDFEPGSVVLARRGNTVRLGRISLTRDGNAAVEGGSFKEMLLDEFVELRRRDELSLEARKTQPHIIGVVIGLSRRI